MKGNDKGEEIGIVWEGCLWLGQLSILLVSGWVVGAGKDPGGRGTSTANGCCGTPGLGRSHWGQDGRGIGRQRGAFRVTQILPDTPARKTSLARATSEPPLLPRMLLPEAPRVITVVSDVSFSLISLPVGVFLCFYLYLRYFNLSRCLMACI